MKCSGSFNSDEKTLWGKKSFPNNVICTSLTLQTSFQFDDTINLLDSSHFLFLEKKYF